MKKSIKILTNADVRDQKKNVSVNKFFTRLVSNQISTALQFTAWLTRNEFHDIQPISRIWVEKYWDHGKMNLFISALDAAITVFAFQDGLSLRIFKSKLFF